MLVCISKLVFDCGDRTVSVQTTEMFALYFHNFISSKIVKFLTVGELSKEFGKKIVPFSVLLMHQFRRISILKLE